MAAVVSPRACTSASTFPSLALLAWAVGAHVGQAGVGCEQAGVGVCGWGRWQALRGDAAGTLRRRRSCSAALAPAVLQAPYPN